MKTKIEKQKHRKSDRKRQRGTKIGSEKQKERDRERQ